ncbi:hypothetical protein DdX_10093 [Ditylenchus destructor]|uniref:C2H2-type domain-containing protein n=1 Tax=Ditylenchus destructor TaxID=166010 RepID=A0AAD4MZU5_9BILA|nr:hypothetical protein DdX_10093 [Ditylenchus destructor]
MNPVVIPENIVCCICSASVKFADLESHLAVLHFNSDPYQCDQCDNNCDNSPSRFPTEAAIKEHMREKHKNRDFSYRVWSNPEIDRARENISNCMAQSMQNALKCARTSAMPNTTVSAQPVAVILNGKPTIVQLPTTYEMPQSCNAVVQTPISAPPPEIVKPKLVSITRAGNTRTYQLDAAGQISKINNAIVPTPISAPPSESAKRKMISVTGEDNTATYKFHETAQSSAIAHTPVPAPANVSANQKVMNAAVTNGAANETTELTPELRNALENLSKRKSQRRAKRKKAWDDSSDEILKSLFSRNRKQLPTSNAESTDTVLDTTEQISQSSNTSVQTPISVPPSETVWPKLVTVTGAPMNEEPQLTPSKTSENHPSNNAEPKSKPNSKIEVIKIESDDELDVKPDLRRSEFSQDDSEPMDRLLENTEQFSRYALRPRVRGIANKRCKEGEEDERKSDDLQKGKRKLTQKKMIRPSEDNLVQCASCYALVKNWLWNKKMHINEMHLKRPTYMCHICSQKFYHNSSCEVEEHLLQVHGVSEKDTERYILDQSISQWKRLNQRVREFFPITPGNKPKQSVTTERRVIEAELPSAAENQTRSSESTSSESEAESSESEAQSNEPNELECQACHQWLPKKLEVIKTHINGVHLHFPVYTCTKCKSDCSSYIMARQHVTLMHPGLVFRRTMIKDHKDRDWHWYKLDDHITEFFPTFFTSPAHLRKYNSNRKRPPAIIKKVKLTKVVDNAPPKELIQCLKCQQWLEKRFDYLKTHVNVMHVHFPLYKCGCHNEYESYNLAIKHANETHGVAGRSYSKVDMIKEHPDKKKHWDMLDDRIKEFFPTFFGLPDKLEQSPNIEKRVLDAEKTQPGSSSCPVLNAVSNPKSVTNSDIALKIKAEPEENNEQAEKSYSSIDEVINKVIQPDTEENRTESQTDTYLFCRGCKRNLIGVYAKPMMFNHINVRHSRYPLYECSACQKRFYDYFANTITKHMIIYHDGDTSLIQDNRADYDEQLEERCIELFGTVLDSEPGTSSSHGPSSDSNSVPVFTPEIKTEPIAVRKPAIIP